MLKEAGVEFTMAARRARVAEEEAVAVAPLRHCLDSRFAGSRADGAMRFACCALRACLDDPFVGSRPDGAMRCVYCSVLRANLAIRLFADFCFPVVRDLQQVVFLDHKTIFHRVFDDLPHLRLRPRISKRKMRESIFIEQSILAEQR
jgi:hypothetical protein